VRSRAETFALVWPIIAADILLTTPSETRQEDTVQTVTMPLQLAPTSLTQPILPNWSFHLFNVNLGSSSNPAVEQAALDKVGSYGRQIGHLAEALELIVQKTRLLESQDLTQDERDVLQVFLGDVSAIRQIKASQPDA
jgi:hypothetical protein